MIARRSTTGWLRSIALVMTLACAMFAAASPASADERAAVLAAHAQFYAALNQMFKGDLAAMTKVWSHAGDVTYMGPTGDYEHGWGAVLKDWQGQAAMKLGGSVAPSDMQAVIGPRVAVVSNYEVGENTNAQGKVERLKLRATNIFRKEGKVWKMVGHHTDKLPYLAK